MPPLLSHRRLSQAFLALVCLSYLLVCPHSKVEESFSLQATHDLFYHGITPALTSTFFGGSRSSLNDNDIQQQPQHQSLPYDHLQYPGVVPRSFVAPLLLAWGCQVIRFCLWPFFFIDLAEHAMMVQFLARFLLLCAFVNGWFRLASALDRKTKQPAVGTFLLTITACQFHMPFYGSRMLANNFATVLCLHSYAAWMDDQVPQAAVLMIVTTTLFRCDVLLLLFTAGLSWIFFAEQQKLGLLQAIRLGVRTGLWTLLLTVPLDSLLWQRALWPEGEVFFFNTILNKSSEWGVSAWHFYFSSSLPKSMFLTLSLVPLAFLRIPETLIALEKRVFGRNVDATTTAVSGMQFVLVDFQWASVLLPAFGFVLLYSSLGHKETRFLFPVMPLFNLAAAIGLNRVFRVAFPAKDKPQTVVGLLAFFGCILALFLTWISSICFVAVSHFNYPGGEALGRLSQHLVNVAAAAQETTNQQLRQPQHLATVKVYVDVASAMSGVSLFGQRAASDAGRRHGIEMSFAKAGYEAENEIKVSLSPDESSSYAIFTHLLTEDKSLGKDEFREVAAISGNPRIDWRHARMKTTDGIFIRERRDWLEPTQT